MFDDKTPKPNAPTSNEPVDMFAEVDGAPANLPTAEAQPVPAPASTPAPAPELPPQSTPAPAPAAPAPSSPSPQVPSPAPAQSMLESPKSGSGLKVVMIIIVALIVVGVAGFLAYTLLVQGSSNSNGVTDAVPSVDVIEEDDGFDELILEPEEEEEEPTEDTTDSDGDGLTDAEEATVGTDPNNIDSDADGLGDREEVMVYDTDPLDADTDADGFLDGDEVESGYNPNGDGKLLTIPEEVK
jgi:hypothetical protein